MQERQAVILVVEAARVTQKMLMLLLTRQGYAVETATDGRAALRRIAAGGIDVCLLSLVLPGVDGLEVLRQVRANQAAAYLPMIILTSLASPEQQHAGFEAGA